MYIDTECYAQIFRLLNRKNRRFVKLKQFVKTYYGNVFSIKLILIDNSLEVIKNRDLEDSFVYPTPDSPEWTNLKIWENTNSYKFYKYLSDLALTSYYRIVYDETDAIVGILIFYDGKNKAIKNKHESNIFFKKIVRVVKKSLK